MSSVLDMWTINRKMFLLVLLTLNCGITGVYSIAQIAGQKPCSGTAQYTAFYPETNAPAVLKLRTDLNEQISINSKRLPITYSSACTITFDEKLVSSITNNKTSPFVLVTQLKLHPLFSLHCLLIV